MIPYIIKSSACLVAFMLFYNFFLEKENMHTFKRFYLLTALALAFGIPLITFTQYIDTPIQVSQLVLENNSAEIKENLNNYFPIILWGLYSLGVLIFGVKFLFNLSQIIFKIKQNPKRRNHNTTHVLLQESIVPHTFLSFIFLNKQKAETNQIPNEVILHEETHAKQKHSLDIIFTELIQVLFWFNPILNITKKAIKLNHEFLADREVLNKGISPITYQQTLLAFSSDATEPQLANAINYSLIKKRFTIMKTQTSQKTIWIRSLFLLPLLAILLFSFSSRELIKKPSANQTETQTLKLQQNPLRLTLNGKSTSINKLKEDFKKATNGQKSDLFINSEGVHIDYKIIENISSQLTNNLNKITLSDGITINDSKAYEYEKKRNKIILKQKKATPEQVAEYNTLAKKYNNMPKDSMIFKSSELERLKYLYNIMSDRQRKKAEPFPNIPSPPPPVPNAPKVELPPPPPPPIPEKATPEQKKKYSEAIKNYNYKVVKLERVNAENQKNKIKKEELVRLKKVQSAEHKEKLKLEKMAYKEAKVKQVELKRVYKEEQLVKREILKKEKEAYQKAKENELKNKSKVKEK